MKEGSINSTFEKENAGKAGDMSLIWIKQETPRQFMNEIQTRE
jgi:hypothetical protein